MKTSHVRWGAVAGLLTSLAVAAPSFADDGTAVIGGAAVLGVSALLLRHHHHKKPAASASTPAATRVSRRSRKAKTMPAAPTNDTSTGAAATNDTTAPAAATNGTTTPSTP